MLVYVAATFVLWLLSGALAVSAGLLMATGAGAGRRWMRWLSGSATTLTRGVPTSLLVVAAGLASIRIPPQRWMPDIFPGTTAGSVPVAWAIVVALAAGSAGHFGVIFRTAYLALGRARIEQSVTLGTSPARRLALLGREAAAAAIPPTAARFVHHLHNTAFAALFPVADLFGWIEDGANATFDITRYVLAGGTAYVILSAMIWAGFKAIEYHLRRTFQPGRPSGRPAPAIDVTAVDVTAVDATAISGTP
jgi:ABC-type arginine transport system permease subunit